MNQKALWVLAFLLVFIMITFLGCGDKYDDIPNIDGVAGTITDGRAGPGIAGVAVSVYNNGESTGISTVTDSKGKFELKIPTDTDIDLIASKDGYAGTRFQKINKPANTTYVANMVMKKVFNSAWSVDPPVVTITGIYPWQTIGGITTVTVELTGGQDPGGSSASIALGQETWSDLPAPGYPFQFSVNTEDMPDGPNFCYIIAYDPNNNCVINRVPVEISNGGFKSSLLRMYEPINLTAITRGEDMQYNQLSQIMTGELPPVFKDLNLGRSAGSLFRVQSAENNSACFVEVSWKEEFYSKPQFKNYKIYRGSSGSGPWTSIGYSSYDSFDSVFYIIDTSPQITPGIKIYYKVVPVNIDGEEGYGQTGWVIPLSKFEVNLSSPANNATGVSLAPTFRWNINRDVADYYYYYFELESLSTDDVAWHELPTNNPSLKSLLYSNQTWQNYFDLEKNRKYQWDIKEVVAFSEYSYYSAAISIGAKGYNLGSRNGAFLFTTVGL